MKVLFFTNNLFGKDGWSRYSLDLIKVLKKEKIKVSCLLSSSNPEIKVKQYPLLRAPLHYLKFPGLIFLDFFKITKILKKENPQIIHFLVEPYALFSILIPRKKAKFVLTIHGSYSIVPLLRLQTKFLAKKYYQKMDKIISVSSYTKERLLKILPFLENKIEVVKNGIDFSDAKLCFPKNKTKIILFVGAIKPRKGIEEMIKALKVYNEKFSKNFIFYLIGNFSENDWYFQNLKKMIKDFGLSSKIKFLGVLEEKEKKNLLKKADLFLMLSKIWGKNKEYFEGFGLVFLEANKYGIPVIGPNEAGAKEAIKDGFSGWKVNVFNPEEVAEKIYLILEKNAIKRENCILWAKRHSIEKVGLKMIEIYSELLYEKI